MRKIDVRLAKMILEDTQKQVLAIVANRLGLIPDQMAWKFHSGNVIHEPLDPAGEKFKISLVVEVHRRNGAPIFQVGEEEIVVADANQDLRPNAPKSPAKGKSKVKVPMSEDPEEE